MNHLPPIELLERLTHIVKQVSLGEGESIDELFQLSRETKDSELISDLAEAFGMMIVKVEAREFRLYETIEELQKTNRNLERTQQKLYQSFKALKTASFETIERLARAAEKKDKNTNAHICRMRHYSALIARALNLNPKCRESILYASSMHDIGKIGIPDRILLKPGRLSPSEWKIMKTHTLIGARILGGAPTGFIRLAEIIAKTHHEKWDGSGYPNGLKGKEIPLVGRIVAVADVFDALISDRPYKKAFSEKEAFDIIAGEKGKHFDPRIVDAFFSVKNDILSIKNKFKNEKS